MSKQQYTAEQMIQAIEDLGGNVSAVARKLQCTRQTVLNYADRYVTVRQALDDAREAMLDNAESALRRAILDGQAWAVCFLLKTQGKSRGYVERQEVDNRHSGNINVGTTDELQRYLDSRLNDK